MPVRRRAEGQPEAASVPGVRHRVHTGDATRCADGIIRRRLRCLLPLCCQSCMKTVTLSHGGGGKAMKDLIDEVFVAAFDNPLLAPLDDQARVPMSTLAQQGDRLAITTDSFVVYPLEFPGGDIGKLAVCGTINDLAVGGAVPLYLSCAAIIEEGLPIDTLHRVARSMAAAAREAGVQVVTGDTKVVQRGACDKLFLTTTGVGAIRTGVDLSADRAR